MATSPKAIVQSAKRHTHDEGARLRQDFKLPPRQSQELMMTQYIWSVKSPSADVVKFSPNGLCLLGLKTRGDGFKQIVGEYAVRSINMRG